MVIVNLTFDLSEHTQRRHEHQKGADKAIAIFNADFEYVLAEGIARASTSVDRQTHVQTARHWTSYVDF
jgi:hypothetical protein